MSGANVFPLLVLVVCLLGWLPGHAAKPLAVAERSPAVAGRFYPADADRLSAAVRGYLDAAVAPAPHRPLALVVPHAGYLYSGQIAADGYRQAMGHEYDVVVILGTNHTAPGLEGVSVYPGPGYRTPLGVAPVDRELAAALIAADPRFAYRPEAHEREHSIEVQVPFVQVALPGVRILPAVVGRPDADLCASFGRALARALGERRALIVASSDLSHYPPYDDAVASDHAVLEAIATLDAARFRQTVRAELQRARPGLSTCACGEAPILAAMAVATELGATRGCVISYANSGDSVVPDRSRVVGYGAVAFVAAGADCRLPWGEKPSSPPPALGEAARRELLQLARSTLELYLATGTAPLARACTPAAQHEQGVFVTLTRDGQLRGCIGRMTPDLPLCQAVAAMALQAAFNDRRFAPLTADELGAIKIEISLLTPLQRVSGPEAVVIGRDGVRLVKDGHAAVYLPKVALEQGWDREQLMEHLCLKAGLDRQSWREGAELYTFQAEVFAEPDAG